VLPVREDENVAAWLSVLVGVGAIQRLLKGDNEFVCLVVCERGGCVGSGCLGVGHNPKDCVFMVMGYVFFGS
jgi:hypothetical protein